MRERYKNQPINPEDLMSIAKDDLAGWYLAFDLRVQDLVDLSLSQNPDWENRKELEELMTLEAHKSAEQQDRLASLILELTHLNQEQLEYEVLQTYANQNNYQIIKH